MRGQQRPPVDAACRPSTAQQRMRPGRWPLTRARRAQYDLTWFVNPNNLPYFEVVALEHGYIRGEVNATHFHIQARPCGGAVGAQRAAARCPLARSPARVARLPGPSGPRQRARSVTSSGRASTDNSVHRSLKGMPSPLSWCLGL
jgi:hypothetical protein